jgi:SagB-type dehydrogenase family enzyme
MMDNYRDAVEEARLSDAAEEYHVASRNQAGHKHLVNQHLIHYSDAIQQLMESAPMRGFDRQQIALPSAGESAAMSVEKAIALRRSSHRFNSEPISLDQLAALLYLGNAVQRVDDTIDGSSFKRTVANSENLGSIEAFPVVLNVRGIAAGIYHFDTVAHGLSVVKSGHFQQWLDERVFYQLEFAKASVAIVLTAAVGRLRMKYGLSGYRLALMDAGMVAGQMYVAAPALKLDVCATAGFIDDELDAALGIDGIEMASVLVLLAGPREGDDTP